jgi:protein-S-isoprenylcysteine O-methyltransferase Ste14
MQTGIRIWIDYLWIAIGVTWLIGALFAKRTARVEPPFSLFVDLAVPALGFALVFWPSTAVGILGQRFVPDVPIAAEAGLALVVLGTVLSLWARLSLGANWSAVVTIKEDHQLIRRGAYALVRHPMYTGVLLGLAGTTLAIGELRGLAGLFFVTVGLWHKIGLEERFLMEHFGDAYVSYRKRVRALIPFIL